MSRIAALLAALCLLVLAPAAIAANATPNPPEQIVAGLSENQIAITASFSGSSILVFGAVKRDAPPAGPPLQVIITLQGPRTPVLVSRKGHVFGLWINTAHIRITEAPAFYAIATSAPLSQILSHTDDLRYRISIPRAIREAGVASQTPDPHAFIDALIRLREANGLYALNQGAVTIEQSTLFRTQLKLPANLTEGLYTARIFLTRNGQVIATQKTDIRVRKIGVERWLYQLAQHQPAIYGLLSLVIAILAGWLASAAFRLVKR